MEASILLADSAQTDSNGKVHALGIGWSVTVTPTPAAASVALIHVPCNATNRKHTLSIRLLDADGRGVTPEGRSEPLAIEGEFEAGRPPGLPPGSMIDQHLTVALTPGMRLSAGQTFEWRLEIDGHHEESWSARVFVRPTPTS